jgi:hypothetical protein
MVHLLTVLYCLYLKKHKNIRLFSFPLNNNDGTPIVMFDRIAEELLVTKVIVDDDLIQH